ncbi:MAG: hypothetical protein ACYC8W_07685 [Candidatus Tyrphobacter sp.]
MGNPSSGTPTALTVTFDTNTLAAVVSPETAQLENGSFGAIVQTAVRDGRIRGFFCETVVTVEGIKNAERADVLGQSRIAVDVTSSEARQPGGAISLQFSVGPQHVQPPLDPRAEARVQRGLSLGMRPLRTAATFDRRPLDQKLYPTYEPVGGMPELTRCMDLVNEIWSEISGRGVGRAVAVKLGTDFTKRDKVQQPELWLQGLGRARDKAERNRVAEVCREWADGDSIAAHYGFGMQLFCSDDFATASSGRSVLDRENRKWLTEEYGVKFATLAELAEMLA